MKRKKGLLLGITVAMLYINTISASASYGTERSWDVELPHFNGNYYLKFKTKETSLMTGYAEVTKLGSSGVSIWFNKGTSLKDAEIVSSVVSFDKKTKKSINYKERYKAGTTVAMGIENSDSTIIFRDTAKGIVNYK